MLNNLFLQRFLTTRKKGKKQEINLCLPVKRCVETGLLTIDERRKKKRGVRIVIVIRRGGKERST